MLKAKAVWIVITHLMLNGHDLPVLTSTDYVFRTEAVCNYALRNNVFSPSTNKMECRKMEIMKVKGNKNGKRKSPRF